MAHQRDLTDRRKLFEEELPEWESIIANLAFNLLRTRTIDRGLMEHCDVQNQLREVMWHAIEKYEEGHGATLDTWITKLLRQECKLITQAHYHKVPRDAEGHPIPLLPLVAQYEDSDTELFLDIEDPEAQYQFDKIFEDSWFTDNVYAVFQVLKKKKALNEKLAFAMILSGQYKNDREIAEVLKVNFAKIAEVRFKAKIVFAILEGIPLDQFTKAQNAEQIAKRIKQQLNCMQKGPPVECTQEA